MMPLKHWFGYLLILLSFILATSACTGQTDSGSDQGLSTLDITGIAELDQLIPLILMGDVNVQRSLIEYTQTNCTYAEGLGGPPKCEPGEAEGKDVEVLPFLGPEGSFIRKENIGAWEGLNVSKLIAAYQVSDNAYSEKDYPTGAYALVFLEADSPETMIILQVKDGMVVRIDYRLGNPPTINPNDVASYLVLPPGMEP